MVRIVGFDPPSPFLPIDPSPVRSLLFRLWLMLVSLLALACWPTGLGVMGDGLRVPSLRETTDLLVWGLTGWNVWGMVVDVEVDMVSS